MVLLLLATPQALGQSLGEAARREAERRRALDQQGVECKVIAQPEVAGGLRGNLVTSQPVPQPRVASVPGHTSNGARSLRSYRSALDRLDREIRAEEDRLTVLRARAESTRRETVLRGRRGSSRDGRSPEERLRSEVLAAELRLRRLREERLKTYDGGRREGYHPGELEGRSAPR